MVAELFSVPPTSKIYTATTAVLHTVPTCISDQQSLARAVQTICSTSNTTVMEDRAWYTGNWTNPAAWLIIVYCVASACTLLLLMCHGYLDGHLNLDFSHAAAAQRELRRRRRNSRRMSDWLEVERRRAEEVDTDVDEEQGRVVHSEWPEAITRRLYEEHEQSPTLYAGLDAMQREAMYERQVRDARVLVRLERAGLL